MARILLTRPMLRAHDIAKRFEDAGHSVHHAPVMEIACQNPPLPDDLGRYSGLLVTSASAAACLPPGVIDAFAAKPSLATGPATAAALTEAGFKQVTHFGGEMEGLTAALSQRAARGEARWLYPCGTVLSHTPGALMARTGAQITPIDVYDAHDLGPWPRDIRDLLGNTRFDWAVFLSARTAKLFARNMAQAGLWGEGAACGAACISAPVAAALAPLTFTQTCIAPEKTTSSLVEAMGVTYC